MFDEFFVGGIYLDVSQCALGVAIGEGVGEAFLSGGDVLAAEDVEEFDVFQVRGFDLLDGAEDGFVGGGFGNKHGDIAADGGERGQGF